MEIGEDVLVFEEGICGGLSNCEGGICEVVCW